MNNRLFRIYWNIHDLLGKMRKKIKIQIIFQFLIKLSNYICFHSGKINFKGDICETSIMLLDSNQCFTMTALGYHTYMWKKLPRQISFYGSIYSKNGSLRQFSPSLFSVGPIALKIADFSVFFWKLGSWSKNGKIRFAFPAMFLIKNSVKTYTVTRKND